jgi:hypothetical protein
MRGRYKDRPLSIVPLEKVPCLHNIRYYCAQLNAMQILQKESRRRTNNNITFVRHLLGFLHRPLWHGLDLLTPRPTGAQLFVIHARHFDAAVPCQFGPARDSRYLSDIW